MAVINRREVVSSAIAATCGLAIASPASATRGAQKIVKNGRLKQSVSRWCYAKIPMPEFCRAVADMGLTAIDLLQPNEWAPLKEFGLTCSMGSGVGGNIPVGFNNPANHDALVKALTEGIPQAAKAGVPNVITFFGNLQPNMTEAQAIENCVNGLNRVKKVAEDNGVMVCVELLNSKVNHPDYQGCLLYTSDAADE